MANKDESSLFVNVSEPVADGRSLFDLTREEHKEALRLSGAVRDQLSRRETMAANECRLFIDVSEPVKNEYRVVRHYFDTSEEMEAAIGLHGANVRAVYWAEQPHAEENPMPEGEN
jgi:hypothetical protein